MIEDLIKLKKQIDTMIETYKDLHPDDDIHYDVSGNDVDQVEYEKQRALKRIREGYYESTFREKQGKKATESRERSITLCVYGDSWDEWYWVPGHGNEWWRYNTNTSS